MSRIVFVTRATKDSGKGHFFRVFRMMESLSLNVDCTLVVDKEAITESERFNVYPFNQHKPESFIRELGLDSNDLIWFDIPDSQYEMLKNFEGQGIPLVSTNMFEKIGERRYEDIAIYPVFEKYKKSVVTEKTVQLSGVDFISLPEEFFSEGDSKSPYVLVSMGGTDPMGFTHLVLKAISQLEDCQYIFKVILPKGALVEHVLSEYGHYSHLEFLEFGSFDFANILKRSQYAIINGGMTRYECIAAKTFFIALSIHDTQAALSEKVTRYGLGENFGVFSENDIERLTELLRQLIHPLTHSIHCEKMPSLRANRAKWIYDLVVRELKNKNE